MCYWLMKSEPSAFSITDLAAAPGQIATWDGVRNYQARNFIRDEMKLGDKVLFYHSTCEVPGVVGTMEVVKAAYPDATALNPDNKHYDPRSTPEKPLWYVVDVKLIKQFPQIISLAALRAKPELSSMLILRKGNRLSVTPVTKAEWDAVEKMR